MINHFSKLFYVLADVELFVKKPKNSAWFTKVMWPEFQLFQLINDAGKITK